MKKVKLKYIYYIFFTISLAWSCTPKHSYTIKAFLFDGVPNPFLKELDLKNDTLVLNDSVLANATSRTKKKELEFNLHLPYKTRECSSCHDRNQMGKLRLPSPALCNLCHEDFNKDYKVVHGPVVSGSCAECHKPHQSKLNSLLKLPDQELCLSCHETHFSKENKVHKEVKGTDCTTCHNPHGGNDRFLLESGTCYKCHDNYEEKYTFLHGPVDTQGCALCHGTHSLKTEKHLIKPEVELCLSCHTSKEVLTSPYHQGIENNTCTSCHDPHGGTTREFLLNQVEL